MAKLTEKQKKNIVALYAAGGISQKALAKEYGVSETTIRNTINSDPDFAENCGYIKKGAEEEISESLREYFKSSQGFAKGLIERLLNIPDELIEASSLRERVGAAAYVRDMFLSEKDDNEGEDGTPTTIEVVIEDASADANT